jgi:cathepsin S
LDFLAEFGKSYPDSKQFEQRKENYVKNYLLVRHQSGSSLMKLNHLADWFDEEYDTILGLEHVDPSSDAPIPDQPEQDTL